jgi:hypothetical protein
VAAGVGVGVDLAVETRVLGEVRVMVGSGKVVSADGSSPGVAVRVGPHDARNRKLRPMEIAASSSDLIVMCSYGCRAVDAASKGRFSAWIVGGKQAYHHLA